MPDTEESVKLPSFLGNSSDFNILVCRIGKYEFWGEKRLNTADLMKSLKSLSFSNFDDLKSFHSGCRILISDPLSVTARKTYSRMSKVIFLIVVMVLALAAWAGSINEKYISNVVKEYSKLGMNQGR